MKLKAIDPVVATLILIIVAVVAGVSAYTFVTGFIAQTTATQSPSSIVIDAAKVDVNSGSNNDYLKVIVRNLGQKSVNLVTKVYILSSADQSLLDSVTVSWSTNPVSGGQTSTGTASNFDYNNVSTGDLVIVKVVASDGSVATMKVKAS